VRRPLASAPPCRYLRRMSSIPMLRSALPVLAVAATIFAAPATASAVDTIVFEELKEKAVTYGRYNGRFITCDTQAPVPIRAAFLKHARSQGASDQHLEILSKLFSDGEARTTGLRTGYSAEECREKLERPEAQKQLAQVREWYALPPHLKP
jgi:hypothetical protein